MTLHRFRKANVSTCPFCRRPIAEHEVEVTPFARLVICPLALQDMIIDADTGRVLFDVRGVTVPTPRAVPRADRHLGATEVV